MKHIFLSLIVVGVALCGAASINPAARMAQRCTPKSDFRVLDADGDEESEAILPVILKLADEASVDELPGEVMVLCQRKNLVVAYVPVSLLEELGANSSVIRLEASLQSMPQLDLARQFSGVDNVAAAYELPATFTGRGVVAGFCDIGFDPNHIAFADETTGQTRVKKIVNYSLDPCQPVIKCLTPDEIATYTTDDPDMWHATHVAGILAGGYHGNQYYGVAPGVDIVATTSNLYEAQLLAGVEEIIEYAKDQGSPAVINISISSSTGPRDGTTLFNQYMDLAATDAAICISAGNDGKKRGHLHGSFTSDDTPPLISHFIEYPSQSGLNINGYAGMWNNSERPFSVALQIYDYHAREVVGEIPVAITPEAGEVTICSADVAQELGCEPDETFSRYFSGSIWIGWEVNPENNRFNVLLHPMTTTYADDDFGVYYFLGFEVQGREGDEIDVYASESVYFGGFGKGATSGNSDQLFNDFCAGSGVICVGAYASRDHWPLISGEERYMKNASPSPGVMLYNSYGDLLDGTHLPHICAPGSYLVSAISQPYLEEHPERLPKTTTMVAERGRDHYWIAEAGTSMSSPYLAGVFALWLEADPTLTPDELLDLAVGTAIPPVNDPENPRWGAGVVDAYAGLKEIVSKTGVSNVLSDKFYDDSSVYDLHGRRVGTLSGRRSLRPGVYVANGKKFLVSYH